MSDLSVHINEDRNTKTKIFMVAARLIAEKGYNGVSMREISEKSEVSKPTIYYYFESKEGIYKELLNVGLNHVIEILEQIQKLNIPAKTKLVNLIKTLFHQSFEYPEFVKFLLTLSNFTEEIPFRQFFQQQISRNRRILIEIIQKGIDSGEFGASAKPGLAAEIIAGVISHFLWQQLNSKTAILSDQLAEEIIEILFKGLNE